MLFNELKTSESCSWGSEENLPNSSIESSSSDDCFTFLEDSFNLLRHEFILVIDTWEHTEQESREGDVHFIDKLE